MRRNWLRLSSMLCGTRGIGSFIAGKRRSAASESIGVGLRAASGESRAKARRVASEKWRVARKREAELAWWEVKRRKWKTEISRSRTKTCLFGKREWRWP